MVHFLLFPTMKSILAHQVATIIRNKDFSQYENEIFTKNG